MKVIIHQGLQFRNELDKDLSNDKTTLTKKFGNVTKDSLFTFEYGMKAISKLLEIPNLDMAAKTRLPF